VGCEERCVSDSPVGGEGGRVVYMAPPCVFWNSSTFFPSLSAACFCNSGWNAATAVSGDFC
jgi:hypothetical protein